MVWLFTKMLIDIVSVCCSSRRINVPPVTSKLFKHWNTRTDCSLVNVCINYSVFVVEVSNRFSLRIQWKHAFATATAWFWLDELFSFGIASTYFFSLSEIRIGKRSHSVREIIFHCNELVNHIILKSRFYGFSSIFSSFQYS